MSVETKETEFRFPIYNQAIELVSKPHFGYPEGMTPPICMLPCQEEIVSGEIVLSYHNVPYDQYVEILVRAKESVIPSFSTELRIYRNDTVKGAEGQLLDAKGIKRLSSFLFELGQRIVNYDTYMLENAKTIKE